MVLQDEIVTEAFEDTLARINKDLLNATTPEDREKRFQEYQGCKRAWVLLKKWAAEAE